MLSGKSAPEVWKKHCWCWLQSWQTYPLRCSRSPAAILPNHSTLGLIGRECTWSSRRTASWQPERRKGKRRHPPHWRMWKRCAWKLRSLELLWLRILGAEPVFFGCTLRRRIPVEQQRSWHMGRIELSGPRSTQCKWDQSLQGQPRPKLQTRHPAAFRTHPNIINIFSHDSSTGIYHDLLWHRFSHFKFQVSIQGSTT